MRSKMLTYLLFAVTLSLPAKLALCEDSFPVSAPQNAKGKLCEVGMCLHPAMPTGGLRCTFNACGPDVRGSCCVKTAPSSVLVPSPPTVPPSSGEVPSATGIRQRSFDEMFPFLKQTVSVLSETSSESEQSSKESSFQSHHSKKEHKILPSSIQLGQHEQGSGFQTSFQSGQVGQGSGFGTNFQSEHLGQGSGFGTNFQSEHLGQGSGFQTSFQSGQVGQGSGFGTNFKSEHLGQGSGFGTNFQSEHLGQGSGFGTNFQSEHLGQGSGFGTNFQSGHVGQGSGFGTNFQSGQLGQGSDFGTVLQLGEAGLVSGFQTDQESGKVFHGSGFDTIFQSENTGHGSGFQTNSQSGHASDGSGFQSSFHQSPCVPLSDFQPRRRAIIGDNDEKNQSTKEHSSAEPEVKTATEAKNLSKKQSHIFQTSGRSGTHSANPDLQYFSESISGRAEPYFYASNGKIFNSPVPEQFGRKLHCICTPLRRLARSAYEYEPPVNAYSMPVNTYPGGIPGATATTKKAYPISSYNLPSVKYGRMSAYVPSYDDYSSYDSVKNVDLY